MDSGFDDNGSGLDEWGLETPTPSQLSVGVPATPAGGLALGTTTTGDEASSATGAAMPLSTPGSDRGGIVTARGTGDGLVLRLDGRVDPASLKTGLTDFVTSRRAFLAGQEVALEWVGQIPELSFVAGLTQFLSESFDVTVKESRLLERRVPARAQKVEAGVEMLDTSEPPTARLARHAAFADGQDNLLSDRPTSLFDGVHSLSRSSSAGPGADRAAALSSDALLWDDPDARIIYTTLRSGQKVESEHSIVIFGDVNSGAEVIAGGDIVVLGTLRGVAHAGAYDETGGGRVILALHMQPTQLRIGMVISRGTPDASRSQPEIARVDGTLIVVEQYHARGLSWRRRN